MATLSQATIDSLKKKYATAEELKSAPAFSTLTPKLQEQAIALYTPVVPKTSTTETNVDPMVLQQQLEQGGNQLTTPINAPTTTNTPTPTTTPTTTPSQVNQETGTVPGTRLETPTEQKTQTPDYKDTSNQRQTEILNNLDSYFASNPNMFLDEASFKRSFDVGTGARNTVQDELIMNRYKGKKTELTSMQTNLTRYNELSGMSEQDLMGITDSNDLNLINQDPNLKAKYDAAKKNREILEFVYGKDYGKEQEPRLDGLDGLPDNINAEISTAKVTYEGYKTKMDELQDTMENTYDDLVKQHEGTGVTDSYLRAKANKLNSSLQKEYNDVARQANGEINKYNALVAESQAYLEEENAKKNDWAFKLGLYESMYGDYGDRNQAQAGVEIQTKDFGTTKSPKWMQSLDGGRTRQPIEGITGVGGGGVGGGGSVGVSTTKPGQLTEMETRFSRLLNSVKSSGLPLSTVLWSPQNQADLAFIQNTLAFTEFKDAKKLGVSFGQMTNPEREMLRKTATSLSPLTTKSYTIDEIYRLAPNLKTIGTKSGGTTSTTSTTQGTTPLGIRVGSSQYSRF